MGNFEKETIQEMKESCLNCWNMWLEGSRLALSNFVKETVKEMREFWKVPELLESVAEGFQASFGELCKGSYTGNERILEGA